MYVCMYVCMYVRMYIYIYIDSSIQVQHIYIYIYMYNSVYTTSLARAAEEVLKSSTDSSGQESRKTTNSRIPCWPAFRATFAKDSSQGCVCLVLVP